MSVNNSYWSYQAKRFSFLKKTHHKTFHAWCHVQYVLVSTHFSNPKGFCADQSREIHSQYFCDTNKWNRQQNQARAPPLVWLAETPCHTPNHLPSHDPLHLERASYYWSLLSDESQVDYFCQQQVELAYQKVLNIYPVKPLSLH